MVKAGSHCDISISILRKCICTLSSKMADHDEEEELLEIGILLLISRRRNRKARNVPTPRKRNVCVRKDFEVGRLFIVQRYIFVQPLPVFLQIQPPFFGGHFLERDWTPLSCFSADGKTADILMFMLMHDRFTHAT